MGVLKACRAYGVTLQALAGLAGAGLLSEAQITIVDYWRPILNDACASPPNEAILVLIERGLGILVTTEMEAR